MPAANATTPLASRSPQSVALDNVLRRELRLSDPYDPDQIATALLGMYPVVKDQMDRERNGFSYSDTPAPIAVAYASGGATCAEVEQGRDDLERDLATLTNASELKDIRVELAGWGRAVRQAATDGLAAGSLALDVNNFDRAMSARRTLSDYARLARYVGTMSADTGTYFRRFSQSCDVMGGLVLVAMGEGLAANGVTRGSALIRVAAGDLQARRNAVVYALRNLKGAVEGSLDQGAWPYGMEAYRNLFGQLEAAGQTDLRTLLEESAMAAALDQLVDLAAGATGSGLRELSTASTMLLQRLVQLVQYGQATELAPDAPAGFAAPESPSLAAFVSALQLFIDAFTNSSSGRLLYLARPAIVTYGLYGMAGPDQATRRLINLTMAQGQISEQIDCFATCGCDEQSSRTAVLLDMVKSMLGRAIDFYAVGSHPMGRGDPEIRAAAAGFLIETLLIRPDELGHHGFDDPGGQAPAAGGISRTLRWELENLQNGLFLGVQDPQDPRTQALVAQELRIQFHSEERIERLVQSLCASCRMGGVLEFRNRLWGGMLHSHSIARDALYLTLDQWGLEPGLPNIVNMPQSLESSAHGLLNRGQFVNAGFQ